MLNLTNTLDISFIPEFLTVYILKKYLIWEYSKYTNITYFKTNVLNGLNSLASKTIFSKLHFFPVDNSPYKIIILSKLIGAICFHHK